MHVMEANLIQMRSFFGNFLIFRPRFRYNNSNATIAAILSYVITFYEKQKCIAKDRLRDARTGRPCLYEDMGCYLGLLWVSF